MILARCRLALALCLAPFAARGDVLISEFMAANATTLPDADGQYNDWIELWNSSATNVNLLDWALTDSANNLFKWRFPATNLPPGSFLVVFASNKDRRAPGAELHTNFKLDAGGEYLALVRPDGSIATQFAPYPGQLSDVSYGAAMDAQFIPVLAADAALRLRVPSDGSLGTNWMAADFDDSVWQRGTNGVGFDTGQIDKTRDTFANAVLDGSPLVYWRLNEPGGGAAANSGRLGAAGNATFSGSPTLAQAGPRPATFSGFESTNYAPRFNGSSQSLHSSPSLLNNRAAFALAGWFNAAAFGATNAALWGQQGVAAVGFRNATTFEFWTAQGGALAVSNTFALNQWFHVAAVADGVGLSLYVNGALRAQGGVATTNYGSTTNAFRAADGSVFGAPGSFYNGLLDELAVYDRPLSAAEVARLYQGAAQPDPLPGPLLNLALQPGATAGQSTTYANGGEAWRAIDGNTNGVFSNGSVTHTFSTPVDNEWWEANLGSTQRIDRVHLWFRTDCCTERNENLRILIYDSAVTRVPLRTLSVGAAPGSNRAFDLSPPLTGQVVRVEHPTGVSAILSLAEVQVDQWQDPPPPATDLRLAMFNRNATVFLRFPFTLANRVQDVDRLVLGMKCDDGFIAWLNGVRVASRNAPEMAQWNSSAVGAQPQRYLTGYENFDVTAFTDALREGTNVLAIQGLNIAPDNPDFYLQARLDATLAGAVGSVARYFSVPTPGDFNGAGTADLGPIISDAGHSPGAPLDSDDITVTARVTQAFVPVGAVSLHYRVMFDAEQTVAMFDDSLHGDGAAGDGIYGAVIPQSLSTNGQMVRWCITASDIENHASRWPLFEDPLASAEYLGAVIADPGLTSRLPVFHLFVSAQQLAGIDQESGGRVSFFHDGEFYDNIYMERRGNTSAAYNKKSHRLEFNREHPLRHPGPGGRIRKTSLLAEYVDPAYLRQHLSFWFLELIGVPAPFDYPVRTQMNGQFYQLAFHSDVLGEEQLDRMGYDTRGALYKAVGCAKPDYFSTGVFDKVLPKNVADRSDYLQLANGINENTAPATRRVTVFDLLDVPEVINALAGARWCSENDDVWANMSLYRDTYGDGLWRIVPFDMNASWGQLYGGNTPLQATVDTQKSHPLYGSMAIRPSGGPQGTNYFNRLYDVIVQVPETRQMLLRRQRTLLDRWVLPPETDPQALLIENHILAMTILIGPEAMLDRAKWGFSPWAANKTFAAGVGDLLHEFIGPRRAHWSTAHCITNSSRPPGITSNDNAGIPLPQSLFYPIRVAATEANPSSGNQEQEFICLTNRNPFAVDISGWTLGGAVSFRFKPGTVIPSNSVVYVSPNLAAFRSRSSGPRGGQGLFVVGPYTGKLSARGEGIAIRDDTGFLISNYAYSGAPSPAQQYLRVTEIMYNPTPQPGSPTDAQEFEYIEIRNISATANLDLRGVKLTNGVQFDFAGSAVTNLAPGARALVVKNLAAFASRYGAGLPVAGVFAGSLDNAGERIQLLDAVNEEILDFAYNNSWYPVTDGLGFSLAVVDEAAEPDAWSRKEQWRPDGRLHGSPGVSNPSLPVVAPILVNEILTHPEPPQADAIELRNPTTDAVDIGGWFLTDNVALPKKYRIPAGTTIDAGGFVVFTEADFNPGGASFSFSSAGEGAYLFSGDAATNLTGYVHGFDFGAAPVGVSFGRYVDSQGEEQFVLQSTNSFGTNNAAPRVGPVVISEILFHPPNLGTNDNSAAEFIELQNITGTNVALHDVTAPTNTWRLRNAVDFDFPTNLWLAAGARLLVVGFDPAQDAASLAAFHAAYGLGTNTTILGPWSGKLDNSGDRIELKQPSAPAGTNLTWFNVDIVHYRDAGPWPGGDGDGASLQRLVAGAFANDPTNWTAAIPSAGAALAGGVAPAIQVHPVSQSVLPNQNVTFTTSATGDAPLHYQWRWNGDLLPGATNTTFTVSNAQTGHAGVYSVTVFNATGVASSSNALLAVTLAPTILTPPQSQTVKAGSNAIFTVQAVGEGPLRYQWRFNNINLAGATSSTLTLTNLPPGGSGDITVLVTDDFGAALSAPAALTVLEPPRIATGPAPAYQEALQGSTFNLAVTAAGTPPFGFKWRRNGITLLNQTNALLTVTNANSGNAGSFTVLITNVAGAITSAVAVVVYRPDNDQDGISDDWERQYGLATNNAADAVLDADGDLFLNWQEYIAGTDPTNASSYLKVDRLTVGAGAALEFRAVSNRTYIVESTDNPGTLPWARLADVPARPTNRVEVILDPGSVASRFYRLKIPASP